MHSTRSCSGWNSSTIESCFKLRPSFKTETQFKLTKWCLLQSLWLVLKINSGYNFDSAQNHFYPLAFLSRTSNWGLRGGFSGHNCSMEYKWNIFPINYHCQRFLDIWIPNTSGGGIFMRQLVNRMAGREYLSGTAHLSTFHHLFMRLLLWWHEYPPLWWHKSKYP